MCARPSTFERDENAPTREDTLQQRKDVATLVELKKAGTPKTGDKRLKPYRSDIAGSLSYRTVYLYSLKPYTRSVRSSL